MSSKQKYKYVANPFDVCTLYVDSRANRYGKELGYSLLTPDWRALNADHSLTATDRSINMQAPMTPDELIVDMIKFWPDLFPSRTEALLFLCCIEGNGYTWDKEGQNIINAFPNSMTDEHGERLAEPMILSDSLARYRARRVHNVNVDPINGGYQPNSIVIDAPKTAAPEWRELMAEAVMLMQAVNNR